MKRRSRSALQIFLHNTELAAQRAMARRGGYTFAIPDSEPPSTRKAAPASGPTPESRAATSALSKRARLASTPSNDDDDDNEEDKQTTTTERGRWFVTEFGPVLDKIHDVVEAHVERDASDNAALEQVLADYVREVGDRFHEYETKMAKHDEFSRALLRLHASHKKLRKEIQNKMSATQKAKHERRRLDEYNTRAREGVKQVAQVHQLLQALRQS